MRKIFLTLFVLATSVTSSADIFKETDKGSHQWTDLGVMVFNKSSERLVSYDAQGLCFDQIKIKTFADGRTANAKFWLKELWIRDVDGKVFPAALPIDSMGIQNYRIIDLQKTVCAEKIGLIGYKHNVRKLKAVYVTVSVRE